MGTSAAACGSDFSDATTYTFTNNVTSARIESTAEAPADELGQGCCHDTVGWASSWKQSDGPQASQAACNNLCAPPDIPQGSTCIVTWKNSGWCTVWKPTFTRDMCLP